MNKPIEVKLSIDANGFLKTLKEIEEEVNRMKSVTDSIKTINITVNVSAAQDVDAIVSRITENLENELVNMGKIIY